MGVRTRSATSSPVKPSSKILEPKAEQNHPLKLFILPENSSVDARFLVLQHPRDSCKKRFYFCPEKGLYEFTKIAASSIDPRSILFEPTGNAEAEEITGDIAKRATPTDRASGYINKAAEFFVATPFDPSFLLLPTLMPHEEGKSFFQPLEDILQYHLDEDKHLEYVFRHGRQLLEDAMNRICDKVEAGEENMYRLSEEKLLKDLLAKCERVIEKGLPSSLEDKFVTRALEVPVLSIKREDTTSTTMTTASGELTDAEVHNLDTEASIASTSTFTVLSETGSVTTDGTTIEDSATAKIRRLQQASTIFTFIASSYMPSHLCKRLSSLLDSEKSPLDFGPLKSHLAQLSKLRVEAAASRSFGDFSRKRSLEDEDFNETREEKKRKLAEEEKRKKAGQSMGVRALKKADVSGMKKMSAFFTKAEPKARS